MCNINLSFSGVNGYSWEAEVHIINTINGSMKNNNNNKESSCVWPTTIFYIYIYKTAIKDDNQLTLPDTVITLEAKDHINVH